MKQQPLSQQSINVAKEIFNCIITTTEDFAYGGHDDEFPHWGNQLNHELQLLRKLETDPVLFFSEEECMVSRLIETAESHQESLLEDIDNEDLSGTDPDENPLDLAHNIRMVEKAEAKLAKINRFLREIRKE